MPSKTRTEAEAMLRDPRLVIQIVDDIQQLGVVGDKPLVLTLYLVGTSRLLDSPLSCIVQGPSSSGKSYPIETIARMMPPEQIIMAKQMTPQALFHMEPGALVHKFIVAGERSRMENDDQAEATRALRELISSHKLSKLMPTKNGNKIETVLIEQDGPIAFIESTTLSQIFEEDANRCILLQTDERPEQTKRILECIGTKYANGSDKTSSATILDRHHALQRILQPSPVIIPFALKIIEKFPSDRVEARRAITHMFSMVSVIAFLHQLQRDRDADGQIIARSEDYAIAVRLLDEPLSRFLGCRISPAALRFHLRLQASFSCDEFTSKQADERENVTSRAVSGWLRELANAGIVEQTQPHRGSAPAKWKLVFGKEPQTRSNIPSFKDIFGDPAQTHSDDNETPQNKRYSCEPPPISGCVPATACGL